ncbi:MAG: hypothetical protein ABI334_09190 [Candidatus Dormiibacterota bacterium]
MIEVAAAFITWVGAALVVLADGRRGLAAGLGLLAAALALLVMAGGDAVAAVAIGAGGAIATFQRWRTGLAGWGIMPPGSTPRLILCVASGLLALWLAASVTTGPGAPLRFAVFVAVGLMGARALAAQDSAVALTSAAGLALAVAVAAGLAAAAPGELPYIVGGAAAAGFLLIPRSAPDGA